MEEIILNIYNNDYLSFKSIILINYDLDISNLNKDYKLITIDNGLNIIKDINGINRKSILENIYEYKEKKIIIIDISALNDKGFWKNLEKIFNEKIKSIPIIIQIIDNDLIPPIFLKNSNNFLNNDVDLKWKLKINRKVIHEYRGFIINYSYIEAFCKKNNNLEIIIDKYKRKYLL
jgi:hypothetical protein